MAQPQTSSTDLTLAEEGGGTLVLTQRALPYLPLEISGKQRAEFVWYPGSPQATVQMLGPEEGVIVLKGYWKDKFIEGTGAAKFYSSDVQINLAQFGSPSAVGAAPVPDVVSLVKIVDNMRRMGRRIKLTWDRLQRIGHITSFTQTWQTTHYCEWELEFSVVAQEETSIKATTANRPNLSDAVTQANQNRANFEEAVAGPKPYTLTPLQQLSKTLNDFDNELFKYNAAVSSAAQLVVQGITAGPNAARSLIASSTGLINSCNRLIGTTLDVALTEVLAISAAFAEGVSLITGENNTFREDSLPFGMQLGGASYTRNIKNTALQIRNNNAYWRYTYQQQLQGEAVASVLVKELTDLRDISMQYYGNQNQWQQLMRYNGLKSSQLEAGMLVFVPQNPSVLGAGLIEGGY